jgi:hypothetical protein
MVNHSSGILNATKGERFLASVFGQRKILMQSKLGSWASKIIGQHINCVQLVPELASDLNNVALISTSIIENVVQDVTQALIDQILNKNSNLHRLLCHDGDFKNCSTANLLKRFW